MKLKIALLLYAFSITAFPKEVTEKTTEYFTKKAGLLDIYFTSSDLVLIAMIFSAWLIRMYMERKNPQTPNPSVEDYIFSFIITYTFTATVYQFTLYKEWALGLVLFPLLMWAILSIDIIRYFSTKEGREKVYKVIEGVLDAITNRIKKIFS